MSDDDLRNAPSYEVDVEQRTPEWRSKRIGVPTCSNFPRIIAHDGNKAAAAVRKTFLWQLVAEQIFRFSFQKNISSFPAPAWGIKWEDTARQGLAAKLLCEIRPGKFLLESQGRYGGSPDGYAEDGLPVEIKCPQIPQQLENIDNGETPDPKDYYVQLQGHCLLTGARGVHFWSWSPFTSPVYALVPRNEVFCTKLSKAVIAFYDEVKAVEARVRGKGTFKVEEFQAWARSGSNGKSG